ncbi:MAG: DUF4118 domain-containing protein [Vulcanimicrobiota bacterium]
MNQRPDPDQLLARLTASQLRETRGELKIYLGYAAGVGKTFAMLSAARQLAASGVDVVVGLVETHGRQETEALLDGLEVLPRAQSEYRGVQLEEFNLDLALTRAPQVILVDELAHTNQPGSRHPKRYHDVMELLEAGIDVYTTVNVQHLESLGDIVKQITGVTVRETVPDLVLEQASQLVLVDIPPEELIARLEQGKVYVPAQAERAVSNFFRPGNLSALREMVLREAARRVDEDVRTYMRHRSIPGPWPAGERLLVCVGPSPLSERLVRAAKRLADVLDAPWVALHIATDQLSPAERERVTRHLELATRLGAEVTTLTGQSMVAEVAEFVRRENVTKIVAGKPLHRGWHEMLRGTLVDQILQQTRGVDIFVIGEGERETQAAPRRRLRPRATVSPYLSAILLVALATLLGQPILPRFEPTNQVMLYLATVVWAGYYLGRGPSFLASVTSVVAFNFFFVPPRLTFQVADPEYLLTFLGLLLAGLLVSHLTSRAQATVRLSRSREVQALTLLGLTRELARATNEQEVIDTVAGHVEKLFGAAVVCLASEPTGLLRSSSLEQAEQAVADWSFRHCQRAGRGTDTLAGATRQWHPVIGPHGCLGVVGLPEAVRVGENLELLEAILGQFGGTLSRVRLAVANRDRELVKGAERLQRALLGSISHDLRIPLVSITGALSTLLEPEIELDEPARRDMICNALAEAERLNRLVAHLLQMSRLEAGAMNPNLVACDVADLVYTTVEAYRRRVGGARVEVHIDENLPFVSMDYVLISQVLTNLLENASQHGSGEITVSVQCNAREVEFSVKDEGPGVGIDQREHVFERFCRGQRKADGGAGLGLSICKGLVEAHGGRIWVEGSDFRFVLPRRAM